MNNWRRHLESLCGVIFMAVGCKYDWGLFMFVAYTMIARNVTDLLIAADKKKT